MRDVIRRRGGKEVVVRRGFRGVKSVGPVAAHLVLHKDKLNQIRQLMDMENEIASALPRTARNWANRQFLPYVRTTTLSRKGKYSLHSRRMREPGGIVPKTKWAGKNPSRYSKGAGKIMTSGRSQEIALDLYFGSPVIFSRWHEKGFVGTLMAWDPHSGKRIPKVYNYKGRHYLGRPLERKIGDLHNELSETILAILEGRRRKAMKKASKMGFPRKRGTVRGGELPPPAGIKEGYSISPEDFWGGRI